MPEVEERTALVDKSIEYIRDVWDRASKLGIAVVDNVVAVEDVDAQGLQAAGGRDARVEVACFLSGLHAGPVHAGVQVHVDAEVGAGGVRLSRGQRQRITIARAILRNPDILIFDEATSQIDAESVHKIHDAVEKFLEGRTALIIAHRFSTILQADRIVVMDRGKIVDSGPHSELIKRCSLYKSLYGSQIIRDEDVGSGERDASEVVA